MFNDILVVRQSTSQKQLKEERAYFGSQIAGTVWGGGEGSRNSGSQPPAGGRGTSDDLSSCVLFMQDLNSWVLLLI